MDVLKLFKDSLKYPIKDWNKYYILGILFIITGLGSVYQTSKENLYLPLTQTNVSSDLVLNTVFEQQFLQAGGIYTLFALLSIIISIFIAGYALSIIRKTIDLEDEIPDFSWKKNMVDGLKVYILEIVYYLIPIIIIIIGLFTPLSVLTWIGSILTLIVSFLIPIATARLAETDKLAEAINIKKVVNKLDEIGWENYLMWILVLIGVFIIISIIMVILGFIIGLIGSIEGVILFVPATIIITELFLFGPYIQMFTSRTLGLIYIEAKNQ